MPDKPWTLAPQKRKRQSTMTPCSTPGCSNLRKWTAESGLCRECRDNLTVQRAKDTRCLPAILSLLPEDAKELGLTSEQEFTVLLPLGGKQVAVDLLVAILGKDIDQPITGDREE